MLLYRGLCAIEELLPGLREQVVAAGGVPLDTGDVAWLGERGWAPFGTPAFELVSATRPLVERLVAQRVTSLPGVSLPAGFRVSGLGRTPSGEGWLAHHLTAGHVEGQTRAMRLAHADAQLTSGDIDLVMAHSTATPRGDLT
ncbi:hypothetical protein IQ64_28035 [Streptomyces stelliscabiei]|uniref:Beta-ketoacyl synthase C-terminal domain-containing protein n=1 Tax=Streptomyces stelliscabiei TaxID=146820 RepID=A0A8I0NZ33_9ACTN|nr:hypothetical protein IQ64_28035 [Streptomyces stelliscabiei]MBE1594444.1 hypothetical protein [Streptomyces stelliscabiei]